MWHFDGSRRCWRPPPRTRTARHRDSTPLQTSVPVPRQTVLWPALASVATPVDAALFNTEPSTAWPRLLDIDDVTAEIRWRLAIGRRSMSRHSASDGPRCLQIGLRR